jgi:drug/metabolite transporter (DMT)-like permease
MSQPRALALAVLFSCFIAGSSSIAKVVDVGAVEMSFRRWGAVGGLCLLALALVPDAVLPSKHGVASRTQALATLSGLLFFAGSITYVTMVKTYGVVQTSIATTATSFVAITLAGLALSETVSASDVGAMIAMTVVTAGWRCCQ